MKNIIRKSVGALLLAATLTTTGHVLAQRVEATSTITTSEGTISEFGPQAIVIKTALGTEPVRYISSETTNYVDENGFPVSLATVTSGLPVTVFYTKVGDTLIASKIMVKKSASAPLTMVTPTTVVATPTTVVAAPVTTVETTTTTSAGTITDFGTGRMIIKTETSPAPLNYLYSETTTYVDESGVPVAIETVKSGLPVTVYYTQVGDTLTATKVVVRKVPLIEEKKTTTTTTTINK
ncbi:MAG: hypothetical protein Q8M07_22555 [Prosthecobacter sp.]|nr:hypothetical protein [Prosthecobacter sp.]